MQLQENYPLSAFSIKGPESSSDGQDWKFSQVPIAEISGHCWMVMRKMPSKIKEYSLVKFWQHRVGQIMVIPPKKNKSQMLHVAREESKKMQACVII